MEFALSFVSKFANFIVAILSCFDRVIFKGHLPFWTDKLALTESLADRLIDPRRQDRVRYQSVELLRERIDAMALGESDQDDLDRLAHDPAMKMAAWDLAKTSSTNGWPANPPIPGSSIGWPAGCKTNLKAVRSALFDWTHRHVKSTGSSDRRVRSATIDIDSFPIQVYGQQPATAYVHGYPLPSLRDSGKAQLQKAQARGSYRNLLPSLAIRAMEAFT